MKTGEGMKMRILLVTVALMLPATAASAPVPAGDMPVIDPAPRDRGQCPPVSRYHAMKKGGPPAARKLADLPPADTYHAAYRTIDGCEAPILVRYGVNGGR